MHELLVHNEGAECYVMRYFHESDIWWLSNESGHGIGLKEPDIFYMFDKYFKEHK